MNVISMKDVTVSCVPVFVPHLDPNLHKLVCKVTKQMPVGPSVSGETKTYDVAFCGKRAEIAAMVLKQGSKVTLKGHFFFTSFINDDGRNVGRATLMVHQLHLPEPTRVHHRPFDYQMVATGQYGRARIWTRGRGFTDVPVSKLH